MLNFTKLASNPRDLLDVAGPLIASSFLTDSYPQQAYAVTVVRRWFLKCGSFLGFRHVPDGPATGSIAAARLDNPILTGAITGG